MKVSIPPPNQWAKCHLKDRANYLPGRAGVYAIFDREGHLYYIGMAKNLTNRWNGSSHHRYHQALETIANPILAWQVVDGRSVQSVETALIRKYRPDWNNTAPYRQRTRLSPSPAESSRYVDPAPFLNERLFGKIVIMISLLLIAGFCSRQDARTAARQSSSARLTTLIHAIPNGPIIADIPTSATVAVETCDRDWVLIEWENVTGWVTESEFDQPVCDL